MAILVQLFRGQTNTELVDLLDQSAAYFEMIDYDNWNNGTNIYALRLEVPVTLFASVEPRRETVEKAILAKLAYLDDLHSNDKLTRVTISPMSPDDLAAGQHLTPPEHEVRRLWPADRFRLFLSHVATHKAAISKLRSELADLGVAGFLAHEDIEPTREWMDEIALALRSMNGLVALFTPEFHSSKWTDQEIGWALGRGVLVMSVRLGCDPYGFVGPSQAATGVLTAPKDLAASIVEVLLANSQTHHEMRRAIVFGFRDAKSYVAALSIRKFIEKITDFSDDDKAVLWAACTDNPNVAKAYRVPGAIYQAIGHPPAQPETDEVGPPLSDDDIPF